MFKKHGKKLQLNKETLRQLTGNQLRAARGGVAADPTYACDDFNCANSIAYRSQDVNGVFKPCNNN